MIVLFKHDYSDMTGSFRRGWQREVPDKLGRELVVANLADEVLPEPPTESQTAVVEPSATTVPAAMDKPKRTRNVKPVPTPVVPPVIDTYVSPAVTDQA